MTRYVLYDYLQVAGGAERLTLDLVNGMPDYQLVVSRIFPDAEMLSPVESVGPDRLVCIGTPLTRLLKRVPEAIFAFTWFTGFLEDAEAVVYSGLYAPLAVHHQKRGRRVYYCHTPPRYVYDWKERYLQRLPGFLRPFAGGLIGVLQKRYEASLRRMDVIVANSENVRDRLQRHAGFASQVIHPPVDTGKFNWIGQGDYFVSLARLEPYKRVDQIIAAFLQMPGQKLVIASGGSEEARLKQLASGAENIIFTGWQSDAELHDLVGNARAAIYIPQDEDFGMSPVEAMSAGKPVIGVAAGGLLETVIDGETGLLIPDQGTPEALAQAVTAMTAERALNMRKACEARAEQFSLAIFLDRMNHLLDAS